VFVILLLSVLLLSPGFLCGEVKYEDFYLSGYALFGDGTPPNEPVKVELTCRGRVEQLTYTRPDGFFKFRAALRGEQQQSLGDKLKTRPVTMDACELSASLPGYTSTKISLGRRGIYQNESVGTILLLPEEKESSGLISVAALAVPREAMERYKQAEAELNCEHADIEEVIRNLRRAVELYPRFAAAWNLLGESYLRSGDLEQARPALTAAIRLDANYVQPCLTLALLELKQGRMVEALTISERALAVIPDLVEALFYHASAHIALGNLREAEDSLRAAMASPDIEFFPRVYFLLGDVLARKGKLVEAAEHFRHYIDLEPDSKAAAAASDQLAQWKKAGYLD
jgi:tetratricopeptide (TPR) repeat protein